MSANIDQLPASKERLEQYRQAQRSDSTCSTLMKYCRRGWPDRSKLTPELKPYWPARGELTIGEELLLHGSRVVVPLQMQGETLIKLHQGHQGIQHCRPRANMSVWWAGISRQIYDLVSQCSECSAPPLCSPPPRQPMLVEVLCTSTNGTTDPRQYFLTSHGRRQRLICFNWMESLIWLSLTTSHVFQE